MFNVPKTTSQIQGFSFLGFDHCFPESVSDSEVQYQTLKVVLTVTDVLDGI